MSRWSTALSLAVARGIPPAAFWGLSVVEWRAVSASYVQTPLLRGDLDALMQQHPDR